jgi:hypothetical protein
MNEYSGNTTSLKKLRVKQKEAIRAICNAGYRDHTAPLFAQLKILPLDQLIKRNILKFLHCFSHKCLPFHSNVVGLYRESALQGCCKKTKRIL